MFTRTLVPAFFSFSIAAAGSPPQVSSPSVNRITSRSPCTLRRSDATSSSDAPIAVFAPFFGSSAAIFALTACTFSGPERHVEIGLARVLHAAEDAERERRARGNRGGDELGERLTCDVDATLLADLLQHAARRIENDFDRAACGQRARSDDLDGAGLFLRRRDGDRRAGESRVRLHRSSSALRSRRARSARAPSPGLPRAVYS